ncbi:MAG: BRO family protein, partial [Cetobacterium sp.]
MSNNNENTAQIAAGLEWPRFNAQNLEHLNKILTYNNKSVRIFGTNEDPWFCGRDVCEILEYSDYRQAIMNNIENENKKSLKDLVVVLNTTTKHTYNDGKMCYINEAGLYSLIFACKLPNSKPFKAFMDQFFYDLRYKSGIMDIFTFMKDKKVAIDVNSPWFQELWYPISKRKGSIVTTLTFLNASPCGDESFILITSYLLNWMGYEGQYHHQKESLVKFLQRNNIPYDETDYGDQR